MGSLYTCDEVAERYGVSVGTIWGWIRNKKLGAISLGKSKGYRVSEEDLRAFEDARRIIPQEH